MSRVLLLVVLIATGCSQARIKPGHSSASVPGAIAESVQPQDPKDGMTQHVQSDSQEDRIIPAGSILEISTGSNCVQRITLSSPMPINSHVIKTVDTKVGAAQKNSFQEIAAKMASMRWLQWIGLLVAGFGIASLAYPPLRLLINSATLSVWCIAAGAAMVFLPLLIVGHELLILGVAGGVVALWFLAHRHGSLKGELTVMRSTFTPPASKPPD